MANREILKASRNLLLRLHKVLVDQERSSYEAFNGKTTSTEFLNLLLNDRDLEWLRRFSTLIVDIDEMFAQKDGFSEEQKTSHLNRIRELIAADSEDGPFQLKYRLALQNNIEAAGIHAEIKKILS